MWQPFREGRSICYILCVFFYILVCMDIYYSVSIIVLLSHNTFMHSNENVFTCKFILSIYIIVNFFFSCIFRSQMCICLNINTLEVSMHMNSKFINTFIKTKIKIWCNVAYISFPVIGKREWVCGILGKVRSEISVQWKWIISSSKWKLLNVNIQNAQNEHFLTNLKWRMSLVNENIL